MIERGLLITMKAKEGKLRNQKNEVRKGDLNVRNEWLKNGTGVGEKKKV